MAVRDVVLDLNGASHVLRSDLGAWAAIEDQGENYLTLVQGLNDASPKMRPILLLLWGYLDHEQPRPSLAEVKRWVTTANFNAVTQAIVMAFRDGVPEVTGSPPPAADAGIGQSSANLLPASDSPPPLSGG